MRRAAWLGARAGGLLIAPAVVGTLAPPARAAFERPALGAPSAALGGLLAVSPDPVFGNPAPPAGDTGPAARFEIARPFGLRELSEAQAGVVWPGRWGGALGGRRFGTDAYSETELRLGLSFRPSSSTAAGLAARFLQVTGSGFAPRRAGALDLGLRLEPEAGLVLAAVAEAVVGEVPGDPAGRGRRTAVGMARTLGPFRLHAEAQRTEASPLAAVLGVSWEPRPGLILSVGAREDPASASAGLSLPLPGASVALAGTWTPPLGTTLRLGIRLGRPAARTRPGAT